MDLDMDRTDTITVPVISINGGNNYRRPKKALHIMGNNTTSSVLHEEEEPPLRIDNHAYDIRSIINENHNKDNLGRPVVIFDRWKIVQDDLKDKQDKPSEVGDNRTLLDEKHNSVNIQSDSDVSSSYEELSAIPIISINNHNSVIKANSLTIPSQQQKQQKYRNSELNLDHEKVQQMHSGNTTNSKPSFVRKPRPNSLAIVSRSHDCIHDLSDLSTASTTATPNNTEVGKHLTLPSTNGVEDTISSLSNALRSVSADALQPIKPTTGLQQRRNRRPTSLHIPNLVQLQPAPSHTAGAHVTTQLQFNSHNATIIRQRSYSMPSSSFMASSPSPTRAALPTTLDEAASLLNKKKITKDEIDEQKLLHRAADSGHVKLAKRCIAAGCDTLKRLSSLNGTSALHCAARADKNSAQIAKLLLETGIDVDVKNDLGETAIFSAIIHRNMETVDVLVDHGSNINSVWQDSTPIYLTIYNRDVESTIKMLKHGAEITDLQEPTRQPLHAVLDLCHSNQLISSQTMQLLKIIVQSDGNVVNHLHTWEPRVPHPGCTSQELIFHIYRMESGSLQNDGKALIRHLIHLGYIPSRGELSTMNQIDQDYDEIYSYIKNGPCPLRDLCVRKIRESLPVNVTHGMERWNNLPEKEQTQILLEPLPENEYENVTVIKRHKDARKSKRKSLKNIMTGISRLSRRFSKKSPAKTDDSSSHLALSLPQHRLSEGSQVAGGSIGEGSGNEGSGSVLLKPSPKLEQKTQEARSSYESDSTDAFKLEAKPKPNLKPKPKFVKKDQDQRKSAAAVADIVKRYSNDFADEAPSGQAPPRPNLDPPKVNVINGDISTEKITAPDTTTRVSASIKIDNVDEEYPTSAKSPRESQHVDDVVVKFQDSAYSSGRSDNYAGAKLTPMKDHAPEFGSNYSLPTNSGSIHIESDEAL